MINSLLLLCVFILLLYHYTIQYGRYGRLINCIPGLPTVPIFGNVLEGMGRSLEDLWIILRKISSDYYPKILNNTSQDLNKDFLYTFLHPWLGTGLLTSEEAKWQTRRKILTPSFHFNMLKQYVNIMIEESNRLTNSVKDIEGWIVPDLISFIKQHTLNAVNETIMGISLHNMGDFQQQYCRIIDEVADTVMYRAIRPWFYSDMIFALSPTGRRNIKNLKILHEFTEKIIAERKLYHERTGWQYLNQFESDTVTKIDDDEAIGIQKKRFAMLDVLIAASRDNHLSDVDIREEVDTFVFAGHETTATAISFAILLLAEHKNVQDRLREEVNAVMHENAGKLTMTVLNKMSYLERCLKETMRLYPSITYIIRALSEDTKFQSYLVPSGVSTYISIYDLHRDPNFWPNPDVFDPDRFLPERSLNRHPFAYIPFSKGPRNCIGERFAILEMKAFIASLVHSFYFESVDYLKDLRFKLNFLNRVTHPIRVRFVPIEHMQSSDVKSPLELAEKH